MERKTCDSCISALVHLLPAGCRTFFSSSFSFSNNFIFFPFCPQVYSSYAGCHFSLRISWTPTAQNARSPLRCIMRSLGWATWIVPWIPSSTPPLMSSSEKRSLRSCTAKLRRHLSDQTEGGTMNKSISAGKYLILRKEKGSTGGKTANCFLKELWSWVTEKLTVSYRKACWLYLWIVCGVPVLQITECKTRNV